MPYVGFIGAEPNYHHVHKVARIHALGLVT